MESIKKVKKLEEIVEDVSKKRLKYIDGCFLNLSFRQLKELNIIGYRRLSSSFIEYIKVHENFEDKKEIIKRKFRKDKIIKYKNKQILYLKSIEITDRSYLIKGKNFGVKFDSYYNDDINYINESRYFDDMKSDKWKFAIEILFIIKKHIPGFIEEAQEGKVQQILKEYERLTGNKKEINILICSQCGNEMEVTAKFCSQCGDKINI